MRPPRLDREEVMRHNRAVLGPVQVPTVLELGRTRLSLAEVDDLRAGDVIRLNHRKTDPGILFVGGKPKYYAHPFASADGRVQA